MSSIDYFKGRAPDRLTSYARVRLVIEVSASGSWSRDTKIDQIWAQAMEAAKDAIMRSLEKDGLAPRIIGNHAANHVQVTFNGGEIAGSP